MDVCCFKRPYDDQSQLRVKLETEAKLFIQQEILTGNYELVWSYVLEYENNNNPYEERRNAIKDWKEVAKVFCTENRQILEFAEGLYKLGIRTKDALHVACAVQSGVDYFITTDKKLLHAQVKGLKIINPIDFIEVMEE
ncbi:MAG: PIN domain-containing protein [Spirochaetaceae bacterium]|nr:PIN domain-containing protein [Spirochaetaceae bacterium]